LQKLHSLIHYIKHWLKAKDEHSLHSPFLFDLYNKVVLDQNPYYAFDNIEGIRKILLQSNQKIKVVDFGAGGNQQPIRSISSIAKKSLKSPEFAQFLFKLINYIKPNTIVELGTSLGITTLYLSTPNKKATVYTFEGSPETAHWAQLNFNQLNAKNIQLMLGNIDQTLPEFINANPSIDFAFIDGNHRYNPTLNYFNQLLTSCHQQSVLVIDDIYWSKEMTRAWEEIKNHPKVTVTIDLYYLGIVFLKTELSCQHFKLKY